MAVENVQPLQVWPAVGLLGNAETFDLALRWSTALAASTIVPKEYQGSPANALIAIEMACRIGASPIQVMQNLHIINGRPAWSSQYIIGAVNSSRRYKHGLKFDMRGSGDGMSCIAWTTEHDGQRVEGPPVSMKMARDEGWLGRAGSKWKTMPELMLRYRAAAFFGRLYCPDLIMGLCDSFEAQDIGSDTHSCNGAGLAIDAAVALGTAGNCGAMAQLPEDSPVSGGEVVTTDTQEEMDCFDPPF